MLDAVNSIRLDLFEVLAEDLLARIGRLRTRDGKTAETPLFLPVINPVSQEITAAWIKENLGGEAVITNAYIIYKRLRAEALEKGVHGILGFDGIIMTDSGGYQVLEYGDVDVTPEEIANLQEDMESDIAVPLDIPTGISGKKEAEKTVEKTLVNLRKTLEVLEKRGKRKSLWTAPIQGGVHLDLLRRCASEEREMGFDLFALGSPTPLMEGYRFDKLFKMISAVRPIIGFGKPLHLFGAGHPMIFPFIVALGVDMFDSASYYLYAKDDRYMTETGTIRVDKLDYLPCDCPVCSKTTAKELKEMSKEERTRMLAIHNLHVCYREIRRVKQAIKDGRLMELLELRARAHPNLYQGFIEIMKNRNLLELMEKHTPISSRRGMNLYDEISMKRPKAVSARKRLIQNVLSGRKTQKVLLIPETLKISFEKAARLPEQVDVLYYGSPFGLVPLSLRYSYPFSQTNYPRALIERKTEELIEEISEILKRAGCKVAYLVKARSSYLKVFEEKLASKLKEKEIKVEEIIDVREMIGKTGSLNGSTL